MGGAVSSGRDNNELIDNLMGGNYIRSLCVERVFRVLDRADFMTPDTRDQAYKDLAWRNGPLHMSAPCIYSEVMEGLELHPGLSFLNVGSGTGYLTTLVGLIIGSSGISHGIEVHPFVVEYSTKKLSQFIENSPTLDEFDFCEPKYYSGNGLCLAPLQAPYDRVYCGAGCPEEYENYFKQLIKVGGILVMPLNDNLVQIRRVSETEWVSRSLLNVSFATLRVPTNEEAAELIRLDEQCPPKLQLLARSVIRSSMRAGLLRRHPELREPPQRAPPTKKSCPRRICIPIEDDSDVDLNALHDLDRAGGAHEMNALLSLVLSMGQNRVAGALRFDSLDSPVDTSSEEEGEELDFEGDSPGDDDDGGGGGSAGGGSRRSAGSPPLKAPSPPPGADGAGATGPPTAPRPASGPPTAPSPAPGPPTAPRPAPGPPTAPRPAPRYRRGLLTFEFRETLHRARAAAPSMSTVTSASLNNSTTDTKSSEADRAPSASAAAPSTSVSSGKEDSRSDFKDGSTKSKMTNAADDDDSDSDNDHDNPGVPAEVEIYLGKANQAGSSALADMEWEAADEHSSGEELREETSTKKDDKRPKVDSGIGEGTTPTSDSSPRKSDSKTDDSDGDSSSTSENITIDLDDPQPTTRRPKRGRCQSRSGASSSGSSAPRARRQKRRAPRPRGDARRVRLSIVMKRGVKELPLPYALKKFVNLGRCFEF